MNAKKAKAERKDSKERIKGFLKAMDDASAKFLVGLMPIIRYTPDGIYPAMSAVDEKGKMSHLTPEAEKANEEERKKATQPTIVT